MKTYNIKPIEWVERLGAFYSDVIIGTLEVFESDSGWVSRYEFFDGREGDETEGLPSKEDAMNRAESEYIKRLATALEEVM
jgi:hypothetical protein